ncbi:MAG: NAD-binding protein [Planctomycetota bacterium]|nr:NAD-binding protein [Planctomycetota bacterium]
MTKVKLFLWQILHGNKACAARLGPRILKGDFEPGFFVEPFLKDLAIVLEESRAMGLALPGVALAKQLYRAVKAHGMGRKGTQALYLALKKISNVE